MSKSLSIATAVMLAATVQAPAQAREPLFIDAKLGKQLTVAQIKRIIVGNSLAWGSPGAMSFQYVAADGALRGGNDKGKRYALKWHLRDYDNLFCVDSGHPASSGCVQLLRSGSMISYRRKDGLVELTATIMPGNALKL